MIAEALMVMALAQALSVRADSAQECTLNDDKIYHPSDFGLALTWTQALSECASRGQALATVKNQAEFNNFMAVLNTMGKGNYDGIWIGASCEGNCAAGNKDGWYWITDNTPLLSSQPASDNWAPGEPDDASGIERVLMVRANNDLKWDDRAYDGKFPWICQECRARCSCRSAAE